MLNPRWIKGMQNHGYKGAFEMGASIDYLFAYDATTNVVSDWMYSEICEKWLMDIHNQEFLRKNNPWVLRDIAERLLEAANRKLWSKPETHELEFLKQLIHDIESEIEKEEYKLS